MPVFVMRQLLPNTEYLNWLRYLKYKKPDVTELQLATIATIISTAVGGKAKIEDFILSDNPRPDKPKVVSDNEIKSKLGIFAQAMQ